MLQIRVIQRADISGFSKQVDQLFTRIKKDVKQIAQSQTPIRSGRARKAWTSRDTTTGFEVKNEVPYIEQLERGRSKQAPRGIIAPTRRAVGRKVNSQYSRLQSGRLSR